MAVNDLPSKPTEVSENPISLDSHPVEDDPDKQDGVRVAEAITASWSRSSLITVYAWFATLFSLQI